MSLSVCILVFERRGILLLVVVTHFFLLFQTEMFQTHEPFHLDESTGWLSVAFVIPCPCCSECIFTATYSLFSVFPSLFLSGPRVSPSLPLDGTHSHQGKNYNENQETTLERPRFHLLATMWSVMSPTQHFCHLC